MANLQGILKSIRDIMWQDTGLNGDAQRIEQLGWMLFFKIFSDKDQELELLDDNYKSPIPSELHWENWAGNDEGMTGEELQVFVDRELFPKLRNISVVDNKRALILREVFEGNNNYMKSGINIRKVLNKLNELDFNVAKDRHAFGELYESILKELQSAGKSGEFYTPRAVTQFLTEMVDPKIGEKVLDCSCGTGGFLTCAIEHLRKGNTSIETLKAIQDNVIGWEYKPLPFLLATTNLILHDVEVPQITFRDALDQPLTNYTERDRVNVILANPPFGGIVANNNETNFPQNFRTKESADLFLIMMIHLLKMGGRAGIVLPDGSLTGEGVKQRVREKLLTDCNLHTIIRLPNSVFQPYATVATNLLFFEKGKQTREVWYYEHRLPAGQKSYSKTKTIRLEEFQPIRDWWNNRTESEVCWKVHIETIKQRGYDLDIKNPNRKETVFLQNSSEAITSLETTFLQNSRLINKIKQEISDGKSGLIQLFEQLGLGKEKLEGFSVEVINSNNFIKELRQAFLREAMQGKLVPQDGQDEPAEILLGKIKAEKEKLIAEKKIKKDKPLAEIKAEEIPFEIPNNWTWCRLGEILEFSDNLNIHSVFSDDTLINYVDIDAIDNQGFKIREVKEKPVSQLSSRARRVLKKGYIVYSLVRPYLNNIAIVEDERENYIGSTGFAVFNGVSVENKFLKSLLLSDYIRKLYLEFISGFNSPSITNEQFQNTAIPLPPLAEQKRIVEKLEKLMKFCDKLEANIRESKERAESLLQVALKEALEPK